MLSLSTCKSKYKELPTVNELDLARYAGTWYEIARLPNSFEKGLECVTATYTVLTNGRVEVLNKGYANADSSKIKSIKGVAWVPDSSNPGRLKVRFFWPFTGKYWVIALVMDYNYALVGDPSRKYLWILSKSSTLDNLTYTTLVNIAKENGFDVEKLMKVNQSYYSK
jgi:apolipoprotein D and lipocalin family protein